MAQAAQIERAKQGAAAARKRPEYGLEEVLRGLTAVAYANGNAAKAQRDLMETGWKVSRRTLLKWSRHSHADDYERIRREILPEVGARVADEHMDLARTANGIAGEMLQRMKGQIGEIPARDLPGGIRNVSTTAGIHTDKARDLAGDYSTPNKTTRELPEVLRALKDKLGLEVEVIDAEAVEETP